MEISRLRAELARVKMERDILGKATAYFAKAAKCSTPSSNATGPCGRSRVQRRVREISVSGGYHGHVARRASTAPRRDLSDDALLLHIKAIHAQTRGGCGWPRTWNELLARGVRVGKDRVQKLMRCAWLGSSGIPASRRS